MGIVTALVVGVVAAGAVAGSAAAKNSAAKKAASAQNKAISQQEAILRRNLDPGALNRLAQTMDRERMISRRALQTEQDPELAELRQYGKAELLKEFQRPSESLNSTKVANQLFSENIEADPRIEALKDSIISRAQDDLDRGAELPAAFQAELVRSGLAAGAGSGIGVSRNQVGGVTSRLLGGAGIQLEAQRTAEAQQLANTAQNLTSSRANILSSIFPTVKAAEDAKLQRAAGAFQIGEGSLPQSGLSGSDAVNLEVARRNAQVAAKGQRGVVAAQKAIAAGDANAAYIQAGASLATTGVGAYSSYLNGLNTGATGITSLPRTYDGQPAGGVGAPSYMTGIPGGSGIQADTGIPGYRTPQQQALFDAISRGYGY